MLTTELFKVCGISYDNANDNWGNCGGVQVLLQAPADVKQYHNLFTSLMQ